MSQALLHVDQRWEGLRLTVCGTLDSDSAAELETEVLQEAALGPPLAVLDLRDLDALQLSVRDRVRRWVDAFGELGCELAVLYPSRRA